MSALPRLKQLALIWQQQEGLNAADLDELVAGVLALDVVGRAEMKDVIDRLRAGIAETRAEENALFDRLKEDLDAVRRERDFLSKRVGELEPALTGLRRAVGAYVAEHKVDRCACAACELTRKCMADVDRILGGETA